MSIDLHAEILRNPLNQYSYLVYFGRGNMPQSPELRRYWANMNKKPVSVDRIGQLKNADGSHSTRETYDRFLKNKSFKDDIVGGTCASCGKRTNRLSPYGTCLTCFRFFNQ